MRLMSFEHTADAVRSGRKTVTRRLGWRFLKRGDVFEAVERARGVPRDQRVSLGLFRVVEVRREPLMSMDWRDLSLEGFPRWGLDDFIADFCRINRCQPEEEVTRIQFHKIRETTA